jgi:hypothetical protein
VTAVAEQREAKERAKTIATAPSCSILPSPENDGGGKLGSSCRRGVQQEGPREKKAGRIGGAGWNRCCLLSQFCRTCPAVCRVLLSTADHNPKDHALFLASPARAGALSASDCSLAMQRGLTAEFPARPPCLTRDSWRTPRH